MSTGNDEPIFEKLSKDPELQETVKFVERAAKAVWAFITSFALAMATVIIPMLIAGHWPTLTEWLTGIGVGLAGAFGVGATVYNVRNKDASVG
jgi:uncharacterized RDD family membrane protein YckC